MRVTKAEKMASEKEARQQAKNEAIERTRKIVSSFVLPEDMKIKYNDTIGRFVLEYKNMKELYLFPSYGEYNEQTTIKVINEKVNLMFALYNATMVFDYKRVIKRAISEGKLDEFVKDVFGIDFKFNEKSIVKKEDANYGLDAFKIVTEPVFSDAKIAGKLSRYFKTFHFSLNWWNPSYIDGRFYLCFQPWLSYELTSNGSNGFQSPTHCVYFDVNAEEFMTNEQIVKRHTK